MIYYYHHHRHIDRTTERLFVTSSAYQTVSQLDHRDTIILSCQISHFFI